MTLHKIVARPQWGTPDYKGSHAASNFSAILSVVFQQKSSTQHVILKYILINHSQYWDQRGEGKTFQQVVTSSPENEIFLLKSRWFFSCEQAALSLVDKGVIVSIRLNSCIKFDLNSEELKKMAVFLISHTTSRFLSWVSHLSHSSTTLS